MDEIFEVEFEEVTIVEPVIEPLSITENGHYEAEGIIDGYSPIDVDVQPPLEELNATSNGEYLPSDNNYGFSKVTVDVPIPGQIEFKDVNFIDYDGTLLYSYTANEFLALVEMPPNPEHDRLIAQGWNWTLEEAKEVVTECGECLIGQEYDTKSGATEIDIELFEGRLSPYLGICLDGTATIDWGDGYTETAVGSNLNSPLTNLTHTYGRAGKYTIKISGGTFTIKGDSGTSYLLVYIQNGTILPRVYAPCVISIYMGMNAQLNGYATSNLFNLKSIVLCRSSTCFRNNVSSIFYTASALSALVIPREYTVVRTSYTIEGASGIQMVSYGYDFGFNTYVNTSFFSGRIIRHISPLRASIIPTGTFQQNGGLRTVKLIGTTRIYSSAFDSCCMLDLTLPNTLTTLENYSLVSMTSLGQLKFTSITPPAALGSQTFSGLRTDCKIYVPRGSLEAYTTATNYPSSATYQYIEY